MAVPHRLHTTLLQPLLRSTATLHFGQGFVFFESHALDPESAATRAFHAATSAQRAGACGSGTPQPKQNGSATGKR
jgi:hypothetical protein